MHSESRNESASHVGLLIIWGVLIITDHIHSTREGNVFAGVCLSTGEGREGGGGGGWVHPVLILSRKGGGRGRGYPDRVSRLPPPA